MSHGRNILQSADGNAWNCLDLIDDFFIEKNSKFHDQNILQGMVNEIFIDENNCIRFKRKLAEKVLVIINKCSNHEYILNNLLNNIKISKLKYGDFRRFGQIIEELSDIKDENEMISHDIDLIVNAIEDARCLSINTQFDEDYKQILTLRDSRFIIQYMYDCLNETKRKMFSELAYEDSLSFVKFFSNIKHYDEDGSNKLKVTIRLDLMEQFINPTNIKENIENIDFENLNRKEKAIVNEFLRLL